MKSYISYVLSVMIIVKKHIGKYLFPYIFLLFCVYRVLRLERKFSYKIDADWFFLKQGILEDSLILGSCLLLYMMIYSVKNRGLEIIGKIIISICFFVYCLDIILFKIMGTRLLVSDVVKLSGDIDDVVSVILQMALSLDGMSIVIFSVILLYTCCLFISKKEFIPKKIRVFLSSVAAGLIVFSTQVSDPQYCHAWIYKNVFTVNNSVTANKSYSDSFVETLSQQSIELDIDKQVTSGLEKSPNIIIVAIESLSSYQSNYFSGLNNMTPSLDRIAIESKSFTNFYANGFTTEGGLIAMLTGVPPIPCPASFSNEMKGLFSFEGFYNPKKSLPELLNKKGYHTEFITTGNASYSNKEKWLYNIGFEAVTGDDHPDYDGWPRYKFNAAPDKALYLHVIKKINSNSNDNPYFYFVENVSTHFPFLNPETNEQTEQAAFSYGDQQLGKFVQSLKGIDFFKNGILIITGDHRTMTPLRENEVELFGESAPARVPLIVVGGSVQDPAVVTETFQQADFLSSFECLVNNTCETTMYSGNLFAKTPIPPKTIIAVNGSDRNLINIYEKEDFSQVLLDGDNTRIIRGKESPKVLSKISNERIAHLKYGMSNER